MKCNYIKESTNERSFLLSILIFHVVNISDVRIFPPICIDGSSPIFMSNYEHDRVQLLYQLHFDHFIFSSNSSFTFSASFFRSTTCWDIKIHSHYLDVTVLVYLNLLLIKISSVNLSLGLITEIKKYFEYKQSQLITR